MCEMVTEKSLQKKLDRAVKLLNELSTDLLELYPEGNLFFEPESGLFIMRDDDGEDTVTRQDHIALSSNDYVKGMDAGGW